MILTEAQLKIIRDVLRESNIRIQTLGDDLMDHLCCSIEERMNNSKTFEDALAESLEELAPNGLSRIEQETIYLINFNSNMHMKKMMYAVGLLAAMTMSIGFMFRIFDWKGGLALLNYGTYAFVFLFVPMVTISYFKSKTEVTKWDKFRNIIGLLSGIVTGLGLAMKFSGIQGGDVLILAGALFFSFLFLPLLFLNLYKKSIAT